MDDKAKLAELNRKIYNAEMAMDKWYGSERAEVIKHELKALRAEKAQLPAELLHQEKVNIITRRLKGAVIGVRKYPDLMTNRKDIKKYSEAALELGIPQAEIDEIIGDALDEKPAKDPTLSPDEAQRLLKQLTANVKAYLDDLSFKAELDPSYTMPDDVVAHVQSWDADNPDKPLSNAQNKVLRTIDDLRKGQVAESDIHTAIRAGQG